MFVGSDLKLNSFVSQGVTGHGQEAEDRSPTKFCSFPRWFSCIYDDDCSCHFVLLVQPAFNDLNGS
ncbi:hypothetical protein RchiOBHm_Chr2g0164451 [Rosa chinensis]|uniref:Uncharacterized protein n=1 Tax=Rosa chinensis TaxID=74649 RepID=A0A2P6S3J1_ROSCH|nr:hypothetical protein RchiOBHm_Chr2g0164451 [Rosa chinensis]